MSFYSYHKGKHGGSVGMVFPYFTDLFNSFPDQQYQELIPAGFLKCQGQTLLAAAYPKLAEVLGTGQNSLYRRDGKTLEDSQLQLPDIGSKYIVGSTGPGIYQNTLTDGGNSERAGIGTTLISNSDVLDFFYTGEFRLPGRDPEDIIVSGTVQAIGPPTRTEEETLNTANFLPHGHNTDMKVGRRVNTRNEGIRSARWSGCNFCFRRGTSGLGSCNPDSDFGYQFRQIDLQEGDEQSTHEHNGASPVIIGENKAVTLSAVFLDSSPLSTQVNLRSGTATKMDDFTPKYILCEFLIKY